MQKYIRTKIICTIGPAVATYDQIVALIRAGMNVARLNFSHGTHEEHAAMIALIKKARADEKVPLAIMLDTKGPEIRLGKIEGGEIAFEAHDRWELVSDEIIGNKSVVSLRPKEIIPKIVPGTEVLFDNGYIRSRVIASKGHSIVVELEKGGVIGSGKGVNIPSVSLDLPAITAKDIDDLKFGCEQDIDIVAASFIRSPDHVVQIKKLLEHEGKPDTLVIAKIENLQGVDNFDSILQVADGIMVARGDLGVEVPLSEVPRLQKMMIRKSYLAGKPAVTATQMLETMIYNNRPTRAEASDVANAIYDSTSLVMLSGETAVGKHPIETVEMMRQIIEAAEKDFSYRTFFENHSKLLYNDVPSSVTLATVKTAYSSDAKAIFALTSSGATARLLSRLRPEIPIIAITPLEKSYHQMSFNWGVIPLFKKCSSLTEAFQEASAFATERGLASYGDLVVVTAGTPFGVKGTTNMMLVESIGDVLVRGHGGVGHSVHGNVAILPTPAERPSYAVRGSILVIGKCSEEYRPFLREAAGVILHNQIGDSFSEEYAYKLAKEFKIPIIVRADGANLILKEGQLVTLDSEKGVVYKGVVLS